MGEQQNCPSCDEVIIGQFCHQCGEKQFSQHDLSISKVAKHAIAAVTDIDGKWLKTIKLLLTQPGVLSTHYLSGIRKHLLTPFQLLLFCSIKFFLIAGLVGYSAFTTPLKTHLNAENFIHQKVAQELVSDRLKQTGQDAGEFAEAFNDTAEFQARTLVMLMVPMFAVVVFLLYPSQSHPVVSSLVFATHVFAFMLLLQALMTHVLLQSLLYLSSFIAVLQSSGYAVELIYSLLMFTCFGVYFYLASRRVYQNNVTLSLIKALVFTFSVYWVFIIYRMILFYTTFYSL
ncbi:DUF3667 domain-containing protein [Marinicella sp. S1101]|uniref:DUF3667 domain-containing protein n=1 Tax=Marinicella marina TaxID=2996016 RepID=UPI002260EA7D|nr:DUF3667 domain-containing protein [Marinicella marina]MCX7553592.1 DUF3667 domain-containing protein [Marinicella marina]MDJ1140216.1 DUF3667 domain-containing protein [Marinicella marina]